MTKQRKKKEEDREEFAEPQDVPKGDWYFVFDTEDQSVFTFFDNSEDAQAYVHNLIIQKDRNTQTVSVVKGKWLRLTAGFEEEE